MNLFYKPSLSELANLIDQNTLTSPQYHVIVDFDGEVLIDHQASLSPAALSKYKFHFTMSGKNLFGQTDRYLNYLNQQFKNLVFCWEKNITGRVNYEEVSKIQNRLYQKETMEMREKAYPVRLNIGR